MNLSRDEVTPSGLGEIGEAGFVRRLGRKSIASRRPSDMPPPARRPGQGEGIIRMTQLAWDGRLGAMEEEILDALEEIDLERAEAEYWNQGEFLVLDRLLRPEIVDALLGEVVGMQGVARRKKVPGYKASESISYHSVRRLAPQILSVYGTPSFVAFLERLTGRSLVLCPDHDPHACAIYQYTTAGDGVGFHYDTSHYKGARYTVLVGLVNESASRLVCQLHRRDRGRAVHEVEVATDPGTVVIFNGDKVYHRVSPLAERERRTVLTMQYVTSPEMTPVRRFISNLKDAMTYFGFREAFGSSAHDSTSP